MEQRLWSAAKELAFPYKRLSPPTSAVLFQQLLERHDIVRVLPGKRRSETWEYNTLASSGVQLVVDAEAYWICDALADYFTEGARVDAFVNGHYSPRQLWEWFRDHNTHELVRRALVIYESEKCDFDPPYLFRQVLYWSGKECTQFKVSLAKKIIEYLAQVRGKGLRHVHLCDPSAGWGDRLIAAMAAGVASYTGIDPNPAVHPGYRRAIDALLAQAQSVTGVETRISLHCEAFESYDGHPDCGLFDIVFTSPPYGDHEIYSSEEGQSIAGYEDTNSWAEGWLFPMALKMWSLVVPGGVLALYLSDTGRGTYCKRLLKCMEKHGGAKLWTVVACRQTDEGMARPLWVWRKSQNGEAVGSGEPAL